MGTRSYVQYCPIAFALDALGDRWSLLILRDLLFGPQRFTDLRSSLTGLATNLLTERLRSLEESGLIAREELPPPAARTVYALTAQGREVAPVLTALARFGSRRLPVPAPEHVVRPRAALAGAVAAFHDASAAADHDEEYRVVIDGESFDVRGSDGRFRPSRVNAAIAATITTTSDVLLAIRRGEATFAEALATGQVEVNGPDSAVDSFRAAFALG